MNNLYRAYIALGVYVLSFAMGFAQPADRPNILWISWEDVSPNFGCYGDTYAITPNIDQLAEEGLQYTHAFSHSGVCAPSRAGIITGMYPTAIGLHHMRVRGLPPDFVRLFPQYLREAGYYCTNDVKTDYQTHFASELVWDESAPGARWQNREKGQPFFSVVNFGSSHEGQIYRDNAFWQKELAELDDAGLRHDPDEAPLPPYFPDHPTVRKDVARYYDNMTVTDKLTGQLIQQLKDEGLWENTIVFFWGDHGAGLTRGKRWIYDSGLKIPLIVRIPDRYKDWAFPQKAPSDLRGGTTDELVAFVDFAPTVLSLAGIPVPEHMHGQAFLGPQMAQPRSFIYAGRDRMDEVYDLIRGVRDKRFKYIRNYLPHLPYAQILRTMERMPTLQVMRQLHQQGKLNPIQALFFQDQKPIEELYDTQVDPHEVNNLAEDPEYIQILEQMRAELRNWQQNVGDVGMVPEPMIDAWRSPNGYWHSTQSPVVSLSKQPFLDGRTIVSLSCPSPGASIVWRRKGQERWTPYTDPFVIRPDWGIEAFASRLGYYSSHTIRFKLGQALVNSAAEPPASFWMDQLTEERMGRLYDLKAWDFEGASALPKLYVAAKDPDPLIAYWAATGIFAFSQTKAQQKAAVPALGPLLNHEEPSVRLVAAQALATWSLSDYALPVLAKALEHPLESVRLTSALALDKLGNKAKGALPFPEIVPGTENQYSHRVFLRMYRKWGMDN